MYSAYKLNKQGDNIQPWHTPFPILNQSVIPCPVLTVAYQSLQICKENLTFLFSVTDTVFFTYFQPSMSPEQRRTPKSKLLNSVPSNNFNRLCRYCRCSDFILYFLCPSDTALWVSWKEKGLHNLLVVGEKVSLDDRLRSLNYPLAPEKWISPCPPNLWVPKWHPVLTSAAVVSLWPVHLAPSLVNWLQLGLVDLCMPEDWLLFPFIPSLDSLPCRLCLQESAAPTVELLQVGSPYWNRPFCGAEEIRGDLS